jgi:hypothetical protein
MPDILFIEVGAVVTEIRSPDRCTIEPFCDPARPPTYDPERRVEVDFARSLDGVLADRGSLALDVAAQRAIYDQYDQDDGSASIGRAWPGGVYEGVVRFRDEAVATSATLAAAVAALPGQRWEYQVVASIDEQTGAVQRYHGFHAEISEEDGAVLVLSVASAGRSTDPSAPRRTVRFDPSDTKTFYAGELVADTLVRGGRSRRSPGAVFIALEVAQGLQLAVPKLPPGAGE